MKNKKTILSVATIATVAAFSLVVLAPHVDAQTASSSTAKTARQAGNLQTLINKGDTDITTRITNLSRLNTRVQAMKRVSSTEKTNITAEINTENNNLTTLKAKIDADTDITTARTDAKQITGGFRIYALVLPQGNIEVASDRVTTIVGMMNTISTKLQARIAILQSQGKDVTVLQSALSDMNAKTSDATSQANSAQSGVANLVPDQGNKTLLASNTTALKSARVNVKTASTDLKTARNDIKTIIQGIRADRPVKTASTTVTTTNQ